MWSGDIGGAETSMATLARHLAAAGAQVEVLFVDEEGALGDRLLRDGTPCGALGLGRGSRVMLNCRVFAKRVSARGPDAAILMLGGILAASLRAGGYAGAIIAVEHGFLAQIARRALFTRWKDQLNWSVGVWAVDAHVPVSAYLENLIMRYPHARRVTTIHNGIDLDQFRPLASAVAWEQTPRPLVIGCAGRLVVGKGFEDIISAAARTEHATRTRVRIAGDGPYRQELEHLARQNDGAVRVEFLGWQHSMPEFWNSCDLAVVPTNGLVESFGMTALEAMACGRPVVAARNGGLPEIVVDGVTGRCYTPGDVQALTGILDEYVSCPAELTRHGDAGRSVAESSFDARIWAKRYLELIDRVLSEH